MYSVDFIIKRRATRGACDCAARATPFSSDQKPASSIWFEYWCSVFVQITGFNYKRIDYIRVSSFVLRHSSSSFTSGSGEKPVSAKYIFRNNALKNGLLPVAVDEATHYKLLDMADDAEISIDLESQTLEVPGGGSVAFSIDPFAKHCLLQGVDQLGYLQSFEDRIAEYEKETEHYVATS